MTGNNLNREDSRLQAIIDGDIQRYILESINQGKIGIPVAEMSHLRSANYFSDEAWETLQASFYMLAKNPDNDTSIKCIALVVQALGEKEGKKILEIIFSCILPDAQKANENGVNISQDGSRMYEMARKRKTLVRELIQTSSRISDDFIKNAGIHELEIKLQREKIFKKKFS
ncbi:hypothetical protein CSB09_03660 [Candidatus Gracilibacteria bacterium]|nr:MAG: hypothetical protein CSB09_03660 [Candidatus Gracilibacteria bacterium]